jgi:uncharacterized protein (TIGR02466 family)
MGDVYGLFQVPVIKQRVHNHEEIKKYLMEEVYPGEGNLHTNLIGTEVYTDYEDKTNSLDQNVVNKLYEENVKELLEDMQFSNNVNWHVNLDTWYNFSVKGGYQHMHDHVGGPLQVNWSGIHYVVLDEEHQTTNFAHPQQAMLRSLWPTTNGNDLPPYCNDLDIALRAEEGEMIWFPPYLSHYVQKQESDKLRATIAINLTVFDHPILRSNK